MAAPFGHPPMPESVDTRIAAAWNRASATHLDVSAFWPVCRDLRAAGLCLANDEDLAAIEIGPFRLASPAVTADIDLVVDILVPAAATHAITGAGGPEALVIGTLTGIVKVFCRAVRSTRMIRDPLAWQVLCYVKSANGQYLAPSLDDISVALLEPRLPLGERESRLAAALRLLEEPDPGAGEPLLRRSAEGGFISNA